MSSDLAPQEIDRFWLELRPAHGIALEDASLKDVRNWTDRGLVDHQDPAPPAPGARPRRLYSLASCIQIAFLHQMGKAGYRLPDAKHFADHAFGRLRFRIAEGEDVTDENHHELFIYSIINKTNFAGKFVSRGEVADQIREDYQIESRLPGYERRIFPIDDLIGRVVDAYLEHCRSEELARDPNRGADEHGIPLDRNRPWRKNE